MRHRKAGRKLGRNSSHRDAMFRNMVTSLMLHGRIRTTEPKAKELRRYAEKVITLGKRVTPSDLAGLDGDALVQAKASRVHAVRQVRKWVNDRDALSRVFDEYSERFKDRPGGYTRIYKLGERPGDNARMVLIELLGENPHGPIDSDSEAEVAADDAAPAAVESGGEE